MVICEIVVIYENTIKIAVIYKNTIKFISIKSGLLNSPGKATETSTIEYLAKVLNGF